MIMEATPKHSFHVLLKLIEGTILCIRRYIQVVKWILWNILTYNFSHILFDVMVPFEDFKFNEVLIDCYGHISGNFGLPQFVHGILDLHLILI